MRGNIGRLQIKVPWSRLRSEPVEFVLEDVVLETMLRQEPDADAYARRQRVQKRLRLDAEELLRELRESAANGLIGSAAAVVHPASAEQSTFLGRLGRAVLDNVRLTMVRVHMRCACEAHGVSGRAHWSARGGGDDASHSAWGFTLERFEISSTDAVGQREYQQPTSDQQWHYKLFVLAGLTVYWQPAASTTGPVAAAAELSLPLADAAAPALADGMAVLSPIDITLLFRSLNTSQTHAASLDASKTHEPHTKCACRISQRVDVRLTAHQCAQLNHISHHLAGLARRERYGCFRSHLATLGIASEAAIRSAAAPSAQAWWKYAIHCVRWDLGKQRRWRAWADVFAFCGMRREYLALWCGFLRGEPSPTAGRLMSLEEELALTDILLFRRLAQLQTEGPVSSAELHAAARDSVPYMPQMHPLPSAAEKLRSGTWLGWLRRAPLLTAPGELTSRGPDSGGDGAPTSSGDIAGDDDECDDRDGCDGAAGYAPLRLSSEQQEQLRTWMHRTGLMDSSLTTPTVGITAAHHRRRRGEFAIAGAAAGAAAGISWDAQRTAPREWELDLEVHALRVRLYADMEKEPTEGALVLPRAAEDNGNAKPSDVAAAPGTTEGTRSDHQASARLPPRCIRTTSSAPHPAPPFTTVPSSPQLRCAILELTNLLVIQSSYLEASASTRLAIELFNLSIQSADSTDDACSLVTQTLLRPLGSDASNALPTNAVHATFESWSAATGAWPAARCESVVHPRRTGREAGSSLNLVIQPLLAHAIPSALIAFYHLQEKCSAVHSGVPFGPLLREPSHRTIFQMSIGASVFSFAAEFAVQLMIEAGPVDVKMTVPDLTATSSSAAGDPPRGSSKTSACSSSQSAASGKSSGFCSSSCNSPLLILETSQTKLSQVHLHHLAASLAMSSGATSSTLVQPFSVSVALREAASARERTQALTVHIAHVATSLNLHTDTPLLLAVSKPWHALLSWMREPAVAAVAQGCPTAATPGDAFSGGEGRGGSCCFGGCSSQPLSSQRRAFDLACDGISLRLRSEDAHAQCSTSEVRLSFGTQRYAAAIAANISPQTIAESAAHKQSHATLSCRQLDAEWLVAATGCGSPHGLHAGENSRQVSLHTRAHGLSCHLEKPDAVAAAAAATASGSHHGSAHTFRVCVETLRVTLVATGSASQAFLLCCPASDADAPPTAISIIGTSEPGLDDVSLEVAPWLVAFEDLGVCVSLAQSILKASVVTQGSLRSLAVTLLPPPLVPAAASSASLASFRGSSAELPVHGRSPPCHPLNDLAVRYDCHGGSILELRVEPQSAHLLTLRLLGTSSAVYQQNRSGISRLDVHLDDLCATSAATLTMDAPCQLLQPWRLALRMTLPSAAFERDTDSLALSLHAGALRVSLPSEHRQLLVQLSDHLVAIMLMVQQPPTHPQHLFRVSTVGGWGAVSSTNGDATPMLCDEISASVHIASLALSADPLLLSMSDLWIRHQRHADKTAAACLFGCLTLHDTRGGRELLRCEAVAPDFPCGETADGAAGGCNSFPDDLRVRFETQLLSKGTHVRIIIPQLLICACPSELDCALLSGATPFIEGVLAMEMPTASDLAFAIEFIVEELEVGILEDSIGSLRARASITTSASMAGGVYDPARLRSLCSINRLCVEMTSPACEGHRMLVAPCSAAIKWHSGPRRMRAVCELSDVHLKLSECQMRLMEKLIRGMQEAHASLKVSCSALLEQRPRYNVVKSGSPSMAVPLGGGERSSTAGSVSEVSEYFDARDDLWQSPLQDDLVEQLVARRGDQNMIKAPSPNGNAPANLQCKARVGVLVFTLLDDHNSMSTAETPILQLALEASRAAASQAAKGGLAFLCRVQLTLYHYVSEVRRWEPVIASCRIDLEFDVTNRKTSLSSSGPIELDLSTRLFRLQRLAAAANASGSLSSSHDGSIVGRGHGGSDAAAASPRWSLAASSLGEGNPPPPANVGPFVLRNETGTAMCFWIDDYSIVEVASGTSAHLPQSPAQLSLSGRRLHVVFFGFQQLDIRPDKPPYVRRCRLWPASCEHAAAPHHGGGRPSSSAIIHTLLESREHNGTETCTFHSRFTLQNATGTYAHLCLLPKLIHRASEARIQVSLPPFVSTPVPLACLHGWLVVEAAAHAPTHVVDQNCNNNVTGGLTLTGGGGALADAGCVDEGIIGYLELSPAALEVLTGRGLARLVCGDGGPFASCYRVCPSAAKFQAPPQGWLISLHPPLLLHNSLLCDFEYEIAHGGNEPLQVATDSGVTRARSLIAASSHVAYAYGRLAPGSSFPCLSGASHVTLRTCIDGFKWSQPIRIDLRCVTSAASTSREPQQAAPAVSAPTTMNSISSPGFAGGVHNLVHGPCPTNPTAAELHLCLRVCNGLSVTAELSGRVWVVNECHVPLLCHVMRFDPRRAGSLPPPVIVRPSLTAPPVPTAAGQHTGNSLASPPSTAGGGRNGAVLLSVDNLEALPDVMLRAASDAQTNKCPRPWQGGFISLPDLLRFQAHSEDLLLDASHGQQHQCAFSNGTGSEISVANYGTLAPALPRLLQLGVKLIPMPQPYGGSSFLLAVSPRVMLLNRTSNRLLCCQRGCLAQSSAQACDVDEWVAVHWAEPSKPRELLLRRLDRGSEWSGGVALTAAMAAPMAGGSETTLRLRNLETREIDFLRLSWHSLRTRATSGLVITQDASELAAPMLIHNHTWHTLNVKQAGVPVVSTLLAGELMPYAWDEPGRRLALLLHVPALGVKFHCDGTACRHRRPRFASLLGGRCLELHVCIEGATTRIVLLDTSSAQAFPPRTMSPVFTRGGSRTANHERGEYVPHQHHEVAPDGHYRYRSAASSRHPHSTSAALITRGLSTEEVKWQINIQFPHMGISLLDHREMVELLYLSLRGLRAEHQRKLLSISRAPLDALSLAVASVQLDCQLPRPVRCEEVLLQVGVAARGDAASAVLALTADDSDSSLSVLQSAIVSLQEISLRLDEEALDAVAAALYCVSSDGQSNGGEGSSRALRGHEGVPSANMVFESSSPNSGAKSMYDELSMLRSQQLEVASQRMFVQLLRLAPIRLKLSLQRASRPDATARSSRSSHGCRSDAESEEEADNSASASVLRWLRWLGITLIGLDEVPLRLPDVHIHRALLPAGGIAQEVQQQYARALMQQAYMLLPSAALLGDPYGMLRTVQQRWHKQRRAMRHTPWVRVPETAVAGLMDLFRATAGSFLRATGKSLRALSSGLEALLSSSEKLHLHTGTELTLTEAVLRGVGGLAHETARGIEQSIQSMHEAAHPRSIPPVVDALLSTLLVPFGLGRGMQRLAVLLTLGSLTLMRATADACRHVLLGPARADAGRFRRPRPSNSLALYPMCAANSLAGAPPATAGHSLAYLCTDAGAGGSEDSNGLICAVLSEPTGCVLLLTASHLRCVHLAAKVPSVEELSASLWEMNLSRLLLIQERGQQVSLLVLAAPSCHAGMETLSVLLPSADDAARLREIIRVAALNARGQAVQMSSPRPLIRSALLEST